MQLPYTSLLYSVIAWPKKYAANSYFSDTLNADGSGAWTIKEAAVFFVPIWDSELYRGATLPSLRFSGVSQTVLGSTWTARDPAVLYESTLPSDRVLGIYNDSSDPVTITEIFPATLTPLR